MIPSGVLLQVTFRLHDHSIDDFDVVYKTTNEFDSHDHPVSSLFLFSTIGVKETILDHASSLRCLVSLFNSPIRTQPLWTIATLCVYQIFVMSLISFMESNQADTISELYNLCNNMVSARVEE